MANRRRKVNEIGKKLAKPLLTRHGYTSIQNLNDLNLNYPKKIHCTGFLAERERVKYTILVEPRNKYERSGGLNTSYRLEEHCCRLADTLGKQLNAKGAWIAISLERKTFSAYFGLLSLLKGKLAIPMHQEGLDSYECLAKDESHEYDYDSFKNVDEE